MGLLWHRRETGAGSDTEARKQVIGVQDIRNRGRAPLALVCVGSSWNHPRSHNCRHHHYSDLGSDYCSGARV
jgi:hypothetical protein